MTLASLVLAHLKGPLRGRFGGLHYVPFVSGRSPCWIHRSFSLMFPGSICQWVLELTRRYLVRAKSPPWSYAFAIHKAYLYPRRAAPFSHRIYPVNAGGIKEEKGPDRALRTHPRTEVIKYLGFKLKRWPFTWRRAGM